MNLLFGTSSLEGLNPAQSEAVQHNEGPILVLAGAGSGKTRVLTSRIARLIEDRGVRPDEILAVTFTNKAAGEMRDRVARLLGTNPTGMWIGTFHAIGARVLRTHAHLAGRTPTFTIYDEDDTLQLLKRVMEQAGVSPKDRAPKAVLAFISDAKNALVEPEEYASLARDSFARDVAEVFTRLEPEMRRNNAVSFDDLLVLPVNILRHNADVLAKLRSRFRYLLVDEYQDTNRAQYQLVKMLGGEHANVMVVGDDDQSIYGWRGADIRNILDFEKDFPSAHVVRLEENYRSTPRILELANVVISANKERRGKTLRATRPDGERVSLVTAADERDEAEMVAGEVLARRAKGRLRLRDAAVLYRTNAQSRVLEDAMRKHSIPYRLVGAVRFYDRKEIRDLMAYLKLVANPRDDEAFRRAIAVPRRGLGDTTIEMLSGAARAAGIPLLEAATRADITAGLRPAAREALADFATLMERSRELARDAAVDEILRHLIDAIGYDQYLRAEGPKGEERLENVRELVAGAAETVADEGGEVGLSPLDHFLQQATLVAGVDALDPDADAITMMTLHNAKGLEFPLVFITGLEDGLFPLARAYDDPSMLEEERRLFYVGITRAEESLILSYALQRRRNGELLPGKASLFLSEIPRDLLVQQRTPRARSTGRSAFADLEWGSTGSPSGTGGSGGGSSGGWGRSSWNASRPAQGGGYVGSVGYGSSEAAARRPSPARRAQPAAPAPEDESQDAAMIAVGARVRHRKFGSGTIAEITGTGRDSKVRIDFDDEEIGRKTLVLAQANLEREWD
jgi:DNA helicase-2/ATP-dependent DNA helicase PcrA